MLIISNMSLVKKYKIIKTINEIFIFRRSKLCSIIWETDVINDCKEREGHSVYYYAAYVKKKI